MRHRFVFGIAIAFEKSDALSLFPGCVRKMEEDEIR